MIRHLCRAVVLLWAVVPTLARAADGPPNILIILSDDQSVPHLGCYGNPDVHTPNLDRLAAEGMRMDQAYVTCPQCAPSRASILSGRHPIDIGMTRFSAPLPKDVVIFPEMLREHAGYFAGLCGRSYHQEGALLNHALVKPHLTEDERPHLEKRLDYVKVDGDNGNPTRQETIDQFNEFLDKVPAGRPFFLQLCWHDPHRPFTSEDLPYKHDPTKLTLPPTYPDSPAIREDLAAYYNEVGRMDSDCGRVLKILEDRKLAERTIVLFMGDNGASQYRGKGTLNQLGVHVPLIVRWPGVVKGGSHSEALLSGDDLAPTLLEVAGVERPGNMTGVSFLQVLRDPSAASKRTEVISERGPHASSLPRSSSAFDLGRSITTSRYKFIYNVTWQLPYAPVDFNLKNVQDLKDGGKLSEFFTNMYLAEHRPMFEFYDLQADPWEMKNLDGEASVKQAEDDLKGRLAAWMIHHHDFVPLPVSGAGGNNNRNAKRGAPAESATE